MLGVTGRGDRVAWGQPSPSHPYVSVENVDGVDGVDGVDSVDSVYNELQQILCGDATGVNVH